MESSQIPSTTHAEFKMSWTAYIKPCVITFILFSIGLAVLQSSSALGFAITTVSTAFCIYQVLMIRALTLYTDDQGVWVFSGIFPWAKGISGVKWRDLEDAVYFPNFFSWALKSYTIRIGHRFTKTSEIVLPHICHGHKVVEHINTLHQETIESGKVS